MRVGIFSNNSFRCRVHFIAPYPASMNSPENTTLSYPEFGFQCNGWSLKSNIGIFSDLYNGNRPYGILSNTCDRYTTQKNAIINTYSIA